MNQQQPTYQIAVIVDGQVVKTYPQEVYNQHIIEQYKKNQSAYLTNLPQQEQITSIGVAGDGVIVPPAGNGVLNVSPIVGMLVVVGVVVTYIMGMRLALKT